MEILMLDIETLGTASTSVVLSIAAASKHMEFHTHVDVDSQLSYGATVEQSTIFWWFEQSNAARVAQCTAPRPPMVDALTALRTAVLDTYRDCSITVWSNGAAFDIPILRFHSAKCRVPLPWTFREERCFRTKYAEFSKDQRARYWPAVYGVNHDALYDAKQQLGFLLSAQADGCPVS